MYKPSRAFLLSVFLPPPSPPPLFVLVERDANVAAWAVTESVSCFIIARSSLLSLLAPPIVTVITEKYVASMRMVWPSTLASILMMRLELMLAFYYRAATYSIAAAKLSSTVVAVADPWGVLIGVGAGRFSESRAAFVIIVRLPTLQFAPLLLVMVHEVGLCSPL